MATTSSKKSTTPNPTASRFAIEDFFNIRLFLSRTCICAEPLRLLHFPYSIHRLRLFRNCVSQQRIYIENQRHAAVVKNGGTGHSRDAAEQAAERLDDGLALTEKFVHGQPGRAGLTGEGHHG